MALISSKDAKDGNRYLFIITDYYSPELKKLIIQAQKLTELLLSMDDSIDLDDLIFVLTQLNHRIRNILDTAEGHDTMEESMERQVSTDTSPAVINKLLRIGIPTGSQVLWNNKGIPFEGPTVMGDDAYLRITAQDDLWRSGDITADSELGDKPSPEPDFL